MSEQRITTHGLAETAPNSLGREQFVSEMNLASRLIEDSFGLDIGSEIRVESSLPEVIGYVSPQERQVFSSLSDKFFEPRIPPSGDQPIRQGSLQGNDFSLLFPNLFKLIENDLQSLGGSGIIYAPELTPGVLIWANFERKLTSAGKSPRLPGWHTDSSYHLMRGKLPYIKYLVSDTSPTEYAEGSATVTIAPDQDFGLNMHCMLKSVEVAESSIAPGPDFGVVRLSPFTIHRSPIVPVDTARTFGNMGVRSHT